MFYFLNYIGVERKWNHRQGRTVRLLERSVNVGNLTSLNLVTSYRATPHSTLLPFSEVSAQVGRGRGNGFAVLWSVTENIIIEMTLEISN